MNQLLKFQVGERVRVAYPTHEHRQQGYDGFAGWVISGPDPLVGRYQVDIPDLAASDYFQGFELERSRIYRQEVSDD